MNPGRCNHCTGRFRSSVRPAVASPPAANMARRGATAWRVSSSVTRAPTRNAFAGLPSIEISAAPPPVALATTPDKTKRPSWFEGAISIAPVFSLPSRRARSIKSDVGIVSTAAAPGVSSKDFSATCTAGCRNTQYAVLAASNAAAPKADSRGNQKLGRLNCIRTIITQ